MGCRSRPLAECVAGGAPVGRGNIAACRRAAHGAALQRYERTLAVPQARYLLINERGEGADRTGCTDAAKALTSWQLGALQPSRERGNVFQMPELSPHEALAVYLDLGADDEAAPVPGVSKSLPSTVYVQTEVHYTNRHNERFEQSARRHTNLGRVHPFLTGLPRSVFPTRPHPTECFGS